MTNEQIKNYTLRITEANRSDLVVIMYEIILDCIDAAMESYRQDDKENFAKLLKKGQSFLNELMGGLDYQYEISLELMQLYIYVNKIIIEAAIQKDPGYLGSAKSVIGKLLSAYREVAKQDTSEALMKNTQKVYAGLTYGKNTLDESCLATNVSQRGFMA